MTEILNEIVNLAGRFFIFGFEEDKINDRIRRFIEIDKISGVILFKRNIPSIADVKLLNKELHRIASYPLLVGIDQEGGRVSRFDSRIKVPSMLDIAKDYSLEEAEKIAFDVAVELKELGFNFNFAPVLDIFSNPQNQVIGDRAFGRDADTVIKYSKAFIDGYKKGGVITCGKHFPGHGDTFIDSHLDLPISNATIEELEKREFLPFKAAIENEIDTIMTAHILFKNIDKYPATFSKKILKGILREKLNFKDVIISDDLDMNAIKNKYDIKDVIYKGIEAGVDLFIVSKDEDDMQRAVLEYTRQLIQNKEITMERLLESTMRIDKLILR